MIQLYNPLSLSLLRLRAAHSDGLLERFLAVFENDLTTASRDYLTKFLQGDAGERAPLTVRVLNRLFEVANSSSTVRKLNLL